MALFGFGSRKTKPGPLRAPDPQIIEAIYERACTYLNQPGKGIHVEDLISALGAVAGEACLRAVGQVPIDSHPYAPGSKVFSTEVNRLLCDDAQSWAKAGPETVLGVTYHGALAAGYAAQAFPPLTEVFALLARGMDATAWGFVPLSTTEGRPFLMPLRAAFELRAPVEEIFNKHGVKPADRPWLCGCALAKALGVVKGAIDHGVAARIAVETVNGMAKTAPINATHLAELQKDASQA